MAAGKEKVNFRPQASGSQSGRQSGRQSGGQNARGGKEGGCDYYPNAKKGRGPIKGKGKSQQDGPKLTARPAKPLPLILISETAVSERQERQFMGSSCSLSEPDLGMVSFKTKVLQCEGSVANTAVIKSVVHYK